MEFNQVLLLGYALFLAVMLAINLLYFYQVYKYRLPGDASPTILIIHIALLLTVITATTFYIGAFN